jgi:CheY-like chemotaxis protein
MTALTGTSYCPSCGVDQPTKERISGSLLQRLCAACGLVLKEELDLGADSPKAPKQVLGRIPVQRMTPAELAAAKAAAEKAKAEKARRVVRERRQPTVPSWEREPIALDEAPPIETVIQGHDVREPSPPALGATFEQVVIAEDTALLREIITDALIQNSVSQHVRGCANGEEVLVALAESIVQNTPFALAILDLEMPILNGYQAAIAMRAFERGMQTKPIPIVFFTTHPCDETFRKVLEYCRPARYLNKGVDASPPRIASRLVQVLESL